MMDSKAMLKDALGAVRQRMKAHGFSAKGTSFHRKNEEGNTELISVQKSVKSSSEVSEVTVNYGVYSARVGNGLGDDPSSALDVAQAHWRKRLTREGREQWLVVRATDSAEEAARLLVDAVDSVLSELNEQSSDERLRDVWLTGASPGIGAMQRLLFLAIILKDLGPSEDLSRVVAELRTLVSGGVHAGLVERQLSMAGVQVP
jgi:hypothetical protein